MIDEVPFTIYLLNQSINANAHKSVFVAIRIVSSRLEIGKLPSDSIVSNALQVEKKNK